MKALRFVGLSLLLLSSACRFREQFAERPLKRARSAVQWMSRQRTPGTKALRAAVHSCKVALQFHPSSPEAHQLLAQTGFYAYAVKDFGVLQRVSDLLAKSVQQDPMRIYAHTGLGELAVAMGDYALLKEVRDGLEKVPVEKLSAAKRLQRNQALFTYYGAPFDLMQEAASSPSLSASEVFEIIGQITGSYNTMRMLWDEAETLRIQLGSDGVAVPDNFLAKHDEQRSQLEEIGSALQLMLRADRLWNDDPRWREAYENYYRALAEGDPNVAITRLENAVSLQPAFTEALYVLADQQFKSSLTAEALGNARTARGLRDRANSIGLSALATARQNGTFLPMEDPKIALSQIHLLLGRVAMVEAKALTAKRSFKRMKRNRRSEIGRRIEGYLNESLRYDPNNEVARMELSSFTKELRPFLMR